MPQVIPAIGAFAGSVATALGAGAATAAAVTAGTITALHFVATNIVKIALTAGVYAYQRQQTKKALAALGGSSNLDQGRLVSIREPAATRKLLYGQMRTGGTVVFIENSGANKQYLHMVIVLVDHECEEIGDVYFNDTVVPLDGSGNATGTYAGYARVKKHLGADAQTVDTDLQTDVTSGVWSNDHRLRGMAYLYVRLTHNPDLFPSGVPNITAIVKGRKVYDPRTATTAWSANPALCLRDYLLLSQDRGGLGADSAEVDDDAVEAAANICDESVNLNPSGTETRYLAHGLVDTMQEPGVVIAGLCSAMAGICPYVGGVFKMKSGAHTASVVTIGEDDVRGGVQFATRDSLRSAFNGVKGTYVSSKTDYQPADFPPVVNSTYTTEDGGVRIWRDVGLGFTTSSSCAQRLAKIELERSRQDITVTLRTNLKPIEAHAGDVVALTLARYGWSAKLFEVVEVGFYVEEEEGGPVLGLEWSLRETASGVWDWNNGEETTVDLAPNTTLVNPYSVPAVSGFAAAAAPSGERTAQPRVKLSWSAPANAAVVRTELQYKKTAASDWTDWSSPPVEVLFDYVTDLEVGVSWDFRARHVNNREVRGAWTSAATVGSAPAGLANYQIALTNFRHGIRTTVEGTALSGELGSGGRATTDVLAWAGSVALTPVASGPTTGQFSISAAVYSGTSTFTKVDANTVRLDSISTDDTVIEVTFNLEGITTRVEYWRLWKTYDGGAYWLIANAAAVNKSVAGVFTPSAVLFTAKAILTGAIGLDDYTGRFKGAVWDGSSWSDFYTSASDESSKSVTLAPGSYTKFRMQLYKAGGFSSFLDEIEIPITLDGTPGAPGDDGIDGIDGAYVSFVFKNASSPPSAPTGGDYDGVTETIPSGWTDDPTTPSAGELTYVSKGRYYFDGIDWANAGWSTPAKWFEKGTDGATVLGDGGGGGSASNSSYVDTSPPTAFTFSSPGGERVIHTRYSTITNSSGSTQTCYVGLFDSGGGQYDEFFADLAPGQSVPFALDTNVNTSAGSNTFYLKVKGSGGGGVAISASLFAL